MYKICKKTIAIKFAVYPILAHGCSVQMDFWNYRVAFINDQKGLKTIGEESEREIAKKKFFLLISTLKSFFAWLIVSKWREERIKILI